MNNVKDAYINIYIERIKIISNQMERFIMPMDEIYYFSVSFPKNYLYIQCYPNQTPDWFF